MVKPRPLGECIDLANKPENALEISISLDRWIASYEQNSSGAIVELVNLLIAASGLPKSALLLDEVDFNAEDPLEELINETAFQQLVDDAGARGPGFYIEPYPISDKKSGKRYRQGLLSVWEALIKKIRYDLLCDRTLVPWVAEHLCIASNSNHRGVRHTHTEVAMQLMVQVSEYVAEYEAQKDAKERQQTGKKKRGGHVAQMTAEEVAELDEKIEQLQEVVESMFRTVFLQRYRDVCEEIRVCCLSALGRCITTHRSHWLQDTYLKYAGWMLNDSASADVRRTSLAQLTAVYKANRDDLEPLRNFTQRFESRIVEMTRDVDKHVGSYALQLVNLLHECDMLQDPSGAVAEALKLLGTADSSTLRALAPLIEKHVAQTAGTDADAADASTSASPAGKKGKKGARPVDGPAAPSARSAAAKRLLQVARLVSDQHSAVQMDTELAARSRDRCNLLVPALAHADPPVLAEWSAYSELLRADTLVDGIDAESEEHLRLVLLQLFAAQAS